jgi:homopolymeric O-antigen transport system permease protein
LPVLKRWFGAGAAVPAEGEIADTRYQKWVIEPVRVGLVARAKELWRYRRILWFLAERRIKDRYEDTTLGKFWLFARPLMPILISTIIFGRLLGVPSDGVPYFLFFLAGSSCWRIFERSVQWVTRSLDQNRGLIKKVYFPRLIAPISSVAPALTEGGVLVTLLVAACIFYYVHDGVFYLRLGIGILAAAVAVAMAMLLAIAVGLWTSVLQVKHKDVQYSIRYFTQLWQYVTPVLFPLSAVPEKYRLIFFVNPMTPIVEMYKWGLLGIGQFPGAELALSIAVMLAILSTGILYFNRSEAASVDRL